MHKQEPLWETFESLNVNVQFLGFFNKSLVKAEVCALLISRESVNA